MANMCSFKDWKNMKNNGFNQSVYQ